MDKHTPGPHTVYGKLAAKLGREPTDAELDAHMDRYMKRHRKRRENAVKAALNAAIAKTA
jgi:hypothetical protein